MSTPAVAELDEALDALREWQRDDAPMQLHPGDVGWFWRFGSEATAAALRVWRRDARVVAVGLLDGEAVLRLTMAPDELHDDDLAHRLAHDLSDPARGVLVEGKVAVEAPPGALVRDVLLARGWDLDEAWTPLHLDLARPVADPGVRIETVGPDLVAERVAVQRASFGSSSFTDERWHAMAAGPLYADARCLLAYDDRGDAVAMVTVWSAGAGRPGVIEPLGVHRDHRGQGHGRAITLAAAAALQQLGSSSAIVCTPTANVGGIATYASAGFRALPVRRDLARSADETS